MAGKLSVSILVSGDWILAWALLNRSIRLVDVRDPKAIYNAIEETVQKLGPNLYVSVANAGVTQVKPLLECTPECVYSLHLQLLVPFLPNTVCSRL